MKHNTHAGWLGALLLAFLAACGGAGGGADSAPPLAASSEASEAGPWKSEAANRHHAWMEQHWERMEQACREYRPRAGRPFDYRDLRRWIPLPEESLRLLERLERGGLREAEWEPVWRASQTLLPQMRQGVSIKDATRHLVRSEVARTFPEHYEILLSTWSIAEERHSDLVGALDNSALSIDLIATSLVSPGGGAAASAGYLVGRWLRERYF